MSLNAAEVDAILLKLDSRDVHVRQYIGRRVFELWADGRMLSWWTNPEDAALALRNLFGIDNDQGTAVESEIQRRARAS